MSGSVLSLDRLAGRTGHGVRVAVIDSGIHTGHPHVGAVAGGVAFDAEGRQSADHADRLGHGTAVAAAIHEKAPGAALLSVRVFDRSLSTSAEALVAAIRWAADARARLVNLSLGTRNDEHRLALADALAYAAAHGTVVVAAAPEADCVWLPGALAGVVAVETDWDCPRDRCLVEPWDGQRLTLRASGFPRPIPGVAPERNLRGQSFAVANACGMLALFLENTGANSAAALARMLLGSTSRKTL